MLFECAFRLLLFNGVLFFWIFNFAFFSNFYWKMAKSLPRPNGLNRNFRRALTVDYWRGARLGELLLAVPWCSKIVFACLQFPNIDAKWFRSLNRFFIHCLWQPLLEYAEHTESTRWTSRTLSIQFEKRLLLLGLSEEFPEEDHQKNSRRVSNGTVTARHLSEQFTVAISKSTTKKSKSPC